MQALDPAHHSLHEKSILFEIETQYGRMHKFGLCGSDDLQVALKPTAGRA
jgi:hypothetical protein